MVSPLILLTIVRIGYATAIVSDELNDGPITTIRYSPYKTTTTCLQNAISNRTLANGALFTFNFYDGSNYKVFQVPKCIFNTDVAKSIFESVNLTESIEAYRRRYRNFFIPPMYGAFRLVVHSTQIAYINSGLSPPPKSSVIIKDFFIDMKKIHHIPKDKLCQIKNHPAMFNLHIKCSHHTVSWKTNMVSISLTDRFFILTVNPDRTPSEKTLALFFGTIQQLDFKAPYNVGAFLLRQTVDHDLIVVVKRDVFTKYYDFLQDTSFLYKILSVNYNDLSICIRAFSIMASTVLRENQCGQITMKTMELFFTYGLCLFIGNGVTYPEMDPISTAAWRQSELELMGEFVQRCFNTSTANPTPPFQFRMTLKKGVESSDLRKKIASFASGMHASTLADVTYLLRATTIPPTVNEEELLRKLLFNVDAYYRASLNAPISSPIRRILIRIDHSIRTQLNASTTARKHFLLLASMCSPRELLIWSEVLHNPNKGSPSEIYSPCLAGARRDYNSATVRALLHAARRPEHRSNTVIKTTHLLRPKRKELAYESTCIPETIPGTTITAEQRTYTITPEYILQGLVYPISNTIVGKNLLITVLNHKTQCIISKTYRKHASITVMKNITFTDQCEFCGSTLVEYDEVDGVTNLIYIPTIEDLKFITNPRNRILVATQRIHYLLLSKNGTVLEVTDILVNIQSVPYVLIVILAMSFILLLLGCYKICRTK
ncbi:B75 [Murid betaherpesvirus 8]|uniref:B75 n=2 Tax=Rat cytomegalovirus (isolate England) TaxID=1261657 RepID=K7XXZ4_RCMVE|nr:E75 [Murid betaherpesvirus 8]AKE44242.1 a75 [Rat cytomegalovirus ALL-03]AFX83390.1 E75 [Murid betaherpesvirus 8]AKB93270.1 B75 [Murid betaherpesvirus 8]WEG71862.1 envelope glycoprotein H [Murid betaherpesvirus 8]WPH24985.1 B75 [Murid betaherpesvirus 8]